MSGDPTLSRLLARVGLDQSWTSIDGVRHDVSSDSLHALLQAMGLDGQQPLEALATLDATEPRWLAPFAAAFIDSPVALALRVPPDITRHRLRLVAHCPDGRERVASIEPDQLRPADEPGLDGWQACTLPWPFEVLPGEHALRLEGDDVWTEGKLLLAPATCHQLPEGHLGAGLAVQTYALRDQRSTPIGDLESLARVGEWLGRHGGDGVLANPLSGPVDRRDPELSPYSPSSRLTIDAAYLPLTGPAIPPGAQEACIGAVDQIRAAALAHLGHEYRALLGGADPAALASFRQWCKAESDWLDAHAAFAVLTECAIGERWPGVGWQAWPAEYRDPSGPGVRDLILAKADAIDRERFAIWRLEHHARDADARARAAGLGLGIGHDLPLGCARHGAETWSQPGAFALAASMGAPPDPFCRSGQDWGLPPLQPGPLRRGEVAPWRRPLRLTMRRGGLMRIDHVMGIDRLWWIPNGGRPQDGAYVRYPVDRLLPILTHDSRAHRCVVVGEDLGTVEPALRAMLARRGVLSTRVLRFERDDDGRFRAPDRYPASAWVTVGTHDLPGTITHRHATDLGPAASDAARASREAELEALAAALRAAGLDPEALDDDVRWLAALHAFLAATPSVLVGIPAEDLVAHAGQVNVPGTIDPANWSHRLPVAIEDWDQLPSVRAILAALGARLVAPKIPSSTDH
jgi:(1->4)-alpha-D-glucan 1-alpha-D-glucosylmutase